MTIISKAEGHRLIQQGAETLPMKWIEVDMNEKCIGTVIWATGFSSDYSWLQVDALDEAGKPRHQRGVSSEPGVYFVGLPWLSRRGSSFIWGVWHDAKHIAGHIATRRQYEAYRSSGED